MIVKERVYDTCGHCGSRKMVSDDVRGCDTCQKVIDDGGVLRATVFTMTEGNSDIDCCSWPCMLQALVKVKCDYFVSLPMLHYGSDIPDGARAQDFFTAIYNYHQGALPQ